MNKKEKKMKNYKNNLNKNNIKKIVNETSYINERFENLQDIWHPQKLEDFFTSYYERIKENFYELSQKRKHFKNFNNILNIFFFDSNNVQENILFNNIFNENELFNYRKGLNKDSEIEEKVALLKKFIINFLKGFKKEFVFTEITEEETKEIVEKLHFEDNIDWYYKIFKNYLYDGATDYINSFESASHYEGSYWNVVTDQEYMANFRSQKRDLENSWEDVRLNKKGKIEYFYQNLLIMESLLEKDTFKYLFNNNVYDCLLCYPLDKFEKYIDEIVIKLLIVFTCSYFINEDEIVDEIIRHISKDDFFYDYFVLELKKIKKDLFLENHDEKLL